MDKYFETLDMAAFRMQHAIDSPKATKLFRLMLAIEHDAGPEADYIIRTWKQQRRINEPGLSPTP